MSAARDIYETRVQKLPVLERLHLATLILNDITQAITVFDSRKTYTDQETSDLANFLLEHAGMNIPLDGEKKTPPAKGKKA
ncbi:MAG TPA: hypothetical protein VL992_11560 [Tepidisphaeraceae bacterium]|nr:hypothetical protein [Tepidisphaeraceae bacterium]